MENKLRNLYALQMIDSHLDELEELKGDLPGEVRALEGQLEELQQRLTDLEDEPADDNIGDADAHYVAPFQLIKEIPHQRPPGFC